MAHLCRSLVIASLLTFCSFLGTDAQRHNINNALGKPNVVVFIVDDMPFLEQWSESAPAGNNLEGLTVTLDPYPTPRIDEFRDEAVVFAKTYAAASKCAPSRISVLTGRQPVSCEFAIEDTLATRGLSTGIYGTSVTVHTEKMQGYDATNNIMTVLKDNGYFTGMVGKWHMMPDDDMGHNLDCEALELFPNEDLYEECKETLKEVGFDYIGAFYYGNVKSNQYFSHNPEWIVDEAQKFVDEARSRDDPFFLYFASTLVHSPDVGPALTKFGCEDTPMGKLAGAYENPEDKTTMWSRSEVWDYANEQADELGLDVLRFATTFWCDMQFGALIDALKMKGVYDDTLVILQNDHGQVAKGLLYEQGTRIINFQRYPPLFGKDRMQTLPDDFVTSNVDLAATIFQLAGVDTPNGYQMDGVSYLDDVVASLNDPDFDQVADGEGSCEYKYLDIKNSHSMVSGQYQYIFRATDSVDTMYDVDKLYPNTYDLEQLYDLNKDPDQKDNIFNDAARMMANKEVIAKFETLMRFYIDSHCIATNGAQCVKPDLRYGASSGLYDIPTEDPAANDHGDDHHDDGGSGGHADAPGECPTECCDDVECRGPKVCSDGVCVRPSSGSGSGSADGGCSVDSDCRGSQVC